MEAQLAAANFRAQLHRVIDQIQNEAVLQAALLLLLPQTPAANQPADEDAAWLQELDQRLAAHDARQNVPFAAAMSRLLQNPA